MTDEARGIVWADITGRTRLTIIKSTGSSSTIEADLLALSNAEVLYDFASTMGATMGTPAAAVFQAVNQSATLVFQTAVGTILALTLPSPQSGIMLPDGVSVDPTAITTLITDCIGTLSDGAGHVATAFVAGFLEKARSDITPIG